MPDSMVTKSCLRFSKIVLSERYIIAYINNQSFVNNISYQAQIRKK
jgi:hypothetical protein